MFNEHVSIHHLWPSPFFLNIHPSYARLNCQLTDEPNYVCPLNASDYVWTKIRIELQICSIKRNNCHKGPHFGIESTKCIKARARELSVRYWTSTFSHCLSCIITRTLLHLSDWSRFRIYSFKESFCNDANDSITHVSQRRSKTFWFECILSAIAWRTIEDGFPSLLFQRVGDRSILERSNE